MEKMIKDCVLGTVLAACSQIKQCQNLMYDMTQLEKNRYQKKDYLNRKLLYSV